MLPNKLAFVDIETTGLSVTRGRIIEIGILRVEDNKLVKTFNSLINPQGYVSPFSLELTGIKSEQLEAAPTFYEIQDEIYELLQDCVFVAHNVRFDYGFIRNEFARFEKKFTAKHFCTVKLFKHLYPKTKRHNLDAVIEKFKIKCKDRHRAFDDAKVLWHFYKSLKKSFKEEILEEAIKKIQKKASLPSSIPTSTIQSLPESPGVYIFYGDNQTPLYVGKSVNIKDRVLSHFSSDYTSSKEMNIAQQVKDIKTISTSGELSALIIESSLIKKLQPLYNRMLRITKKLYVLKKKENNNGYLETYLEMIERINPFQLENIIGIFRSKKQSKNFLAILVKEYKLCEKLVGLEKTKSGCFAYRLGTCKGACLNEESSLKYNMRFIQAFTTKSIKEWPFKGPIIISEKDILQHTVDYFVVDKWCLLSHYKSVDDLTHERHKFEYSFDVDNYKLLVKFLGKKENLKKIKNLAPPNWSSKEEKTAKILHKKYLREEVFAESA